MEFDLNSVDNLNAELLNEAALSAQGFLTAFATTKNFAVRIISIFGDRIDVEKVENLRQQWTTGNFEELPIVEIRLAAEINGAYGAFSSDTNKIYLSQEYITQNASNLKAIASLLLEEIGHFVDSQVNQVDFPGDEGAIFSALVRGEILNEQQLQRLKTENDLATVALDEQVIQIEQANINGDDGNNELFGTNGNDQIYAGAGDDVVNSGLGQDYIDGGEGNDLLVVDFSVSDTGQGMTGSYNSFYRFNAEGNQYADYISSNGVERFQVTGTEHNDTVNTGEGNDTINGGSGNDSLDGGSGNDIINAGNGNDVVRVQRGDTNLADKLDGGAGTDTLSVDLSNQSSNIIFDSTNPGAEYNFADGTRVVNFEVFQEIATGSGNDQIVQLGQVNNNFTTGAGDDVVNSGLGQDYIDGGEGNDLLVVDFSVSDTGQGMTGSYNSFYRLNAEGNQYVDYITAYNFERFQVTGTEHNDTVNTGQGNDNLNGGSGNDSLDGGSGNDIINAGNGNDVVKVQRGDTNLADKLDGGAGTDTLSVDLSNQSSNIIFDSTNPGAEYNFSDGTRVVNFEVFQEIATGSGNDQIVQLGQVNNTFITGAGDDVVNSGLGQDYIDGGEGNDLLVVDFSVSDTGQGMTGSYNSFYRLNAEGNQYVDYISSNGFERFQVTGTEHNDTVNTGEGNDTINGGSGNDTINGGSGNDTINGGSGNDSLDGGSGNDIINAGNGNDVVKVQRGDTNLADKLDGGAGTDNLSVDLSNQSSNIIFDSTNPGAEYNFADGTRVVNFEVFQEIATGSGNDQIVQLGQVNNTFITGAGDDVVNSGLGQDYIDGGEGNDLFVVDFSVSDTGSGVSGSSNFFYRFNAEGNQYVDYITAYNFERFQVTGTQYDDTFNIYGLGDDVLIAGGGADTLSSGEGNDNLDGGSGNDSLDGGSGNDIINAGNGDDVVRVQRGDTNLTDKLDGGAGTDTLSVDLSNQSSNIIFDSTNPGAEYNFSDGTRVANFEVFQEIATGSGNDQIVQLGQVNNTFITGAGDDIVNSGLGQDYIDGGEGNDLFVVDFSVSDTGSGVNGFSNFFYRLNAEGNQYVDYINAYNFERFQVTGTQYDDTLNIYGLGNDVLIGGGGADTFSAGTGDDTYVLDAVNAAGSQINDSDGIDRLNLNSAAITLTKITAGVVGIDRSGNNLIVDLNQDGISNLEDDLSINNFFASRFANTAGFGFLEGVDDQLGEAILNLNLVDSDIVDMGVLSGTKTFQDFVGNSDLEDIYHFQLNEDGDINLKLSGVTANTSIHLLDQSGNRILSSYSDESGIALINTQLFSGNYYVQIYQGTGDTNYTLEASTTTISDSAGNSLESARNLSILSGNQTYSDYVGTVDPRDFYRFQLTQKSQFSLLLEGLTADADIQLLDINGNQVASSNAGGIDAESINSELEAGTYYIQVHQYGSNNTNYNLQLAANPSPTVTPFQIRSISPAQGSNNGQTTTITVQGNQFTPDAQLVLIAPDGTEKTANQVVWYDNTTLTGTFDLSGLSAGAYDVRVTDEAGNAVAEDVFNVNNSYQVSVPGFDNLELFLTVPGGVRPWWTGEVTVTYRNAGDSDITAPLLTLEADGAMMRLSGEDEFTQTSIQFFGINSSGAAGILAPGASGSFSVLFQPNSTTTNTTINFSVDRAKTYEQVSVDPSVPYVPTTIDWNTLKEQTRPESVSPEAWDVIWSNFTSSVGNQTLQYQAVLAENASYLSQLGEYENNVSDLLAFELLQASNYGNITQRFTESEFGRGRTFEWDIEATTDTDGNVTVETPGGSRLFELHPDGSYHSPEGDFSTLTKVGDTYQLQEQGGTVLSFRSDGKLDYIEDTNGNRAQTAYTDNRLTGVTFNNGDSLTYIYNAQGKITQVTDQAGRTSTYAYDDAGEHLLSVTTPDGTTSYSYITTPGATQHAISSITYSDGTQQFFEYDTQGRLIKESSNNGAEAITYQYDSTGGVKLTDAAGAVTQLKLTGTGQVGQSIDPLGRITQFRYDDNGNLSRIIAPENTISSFSYDLGGNLTSQVDPLGNQTQFTYEPNLNQLSSVRDAKDNVTGYDYDSRGNMLSITYDDGSKEQFSYDAKGNLTQSINRRGQEIAYTYDERNQLIGKSYSDGTQVEFTYDNRGNLTSATDATGTTALEYDSANRLTKITYPNDLFLEYAYDAAGRRSQMKDQSGFTINYAYDSLGRLSDLTNASGENIVTYNYDSVGRLAREDKSNGTYTTYDYDLAGQLSSVVNYASDDSVNSRFGYTYDSLGRRLSMSTLEGTSHYGYDASGQLTSVMLPDGQQIQYSYDAAGNRTSVVQNGVETPYGTNSLNQYINVGNASYTYDADGNLISKIEGSQTSTYGYDSDNRLISVTTAEGTWNYEYNAFGDRTAVIHNGERTEYLLDPTGLTSVVGEYSGNGSLVANYTHGLGLESRVDGTSSAYYDFDAIGSTAGLTGTTGKYVNAYSFLPYGEELGKVEGIANPFEYVGQWGVMDEGNGLDFMRARYYDSQQGRFTQQDPIGIQGGFNFYTYSRNSPIDSIDPSGLICWSEVARGVVNVGFSATSVVITGLGAATGNPLLTALGITTGLYQFGVGATQVGVGLSGRKTGLTGNIGADVGRVFDKSDKDKGMFNSGEGEALGSTVDAVISFPGPKDTATQYVRDYLLYYFGNQDYNFGDDSGSDCNPPPRPPTPNTPGPNGSVPVVVSRDPNDVVGPAGFGEQGWLIPDQELPYMIRFENAEDAGASAVFVTVTQQLDPDLDWSSLELGNFGFGNIYIDVPDGLQTYNTRVDLNDGSGYVVDVNGNFKSTTGEMVWTLRTIDPATNDLPTDFSAGFLPPNDDQHAGEGFVSYRVKAKDGLATGTELTAEASIVFDTNEPINTPVHRNTVDIGSPFSTVDALPGSTTSQEFTVSWSSTDDGSGIGSYDIFVSVDGSASMLWLDDTTDTSAIYKGQYGHTYAFYSIARDNVGHIEAAPSVADAIITVAAGTNNPPVTNPDKLLTVNEDSAPTPLDITIPTDIDGDPLTITINTIPDVAKGAVLLPNGTPVAVDQVLTAEDLANLAFTPVANASGSVGGFSYTVSDGKGGTDLQTVTLEITSVNDAPTLSNISKSGDKNTAISFSTTDFTNAFSDVDGDRLSKVQITSLPINGILQLSGSEVTLNQEISAAELEDLTFTPAANIVGNLSFGWNGADGSDYSITGATVNFTINDTSPIGRTITGTSDRDVLTGGMGDDILVGGLGSDTLTGEAGKDKFVYNNFSERTDRITDFQTNDDVLVLKDLFEEINYHGSNPISDSYMRLIQQGNATQVQIDSDGLGDLSTFKTLARLDNVVATSLNTNNFELI